MLRLLVLLAATLTGVAVLGAWYLTRGEPVVDLDTVWSALWGGAQAENDAGAFVVHELRLPRLILVLLCGGALALAGVLLQDSLRNPIADPGLLGVSQAAVLVVALLVVLPGTVPDVSVPLLCLAGGLVTGALLVAAARSLGDPVRLVLVGVVLSMLLGMLTAVLLLIAPEGLELTRFFTYTVGSLSTATWDDVGIVWPWLAAAVPLALLSARALNLLQLGDDVASGLGMGITRARFVLLAIAILLVAPVVAVAGPLAFVALLAPHIARFLLSSGNAYAVLPAAAAIGALVVLTADTLGRLVFFPTEIPAGIWTIAVLGPLAIWLAGSRLRAAPTAAVAG